MARYFAGNTLASFFRTANSVAEVTTAGRFDSTFVPNAIFVPRGSIEYAESYEFSATGTVWTHVDVYTNDTANGNRLLLWNNGTTGVFRLLSSATAGGGAGVTYQPQYWNGSAWTNTGTTFDLQNVQLNRLDIRIDLNSGFKIYKAGTLVSSGTGWSGGGTTITNVRVYSISSFTDTYFSQMLIADFDTRDSRYYLMTMDGNSATNTGGTGTYTDVSETVLDETTAELVSVAGNKMGQTWANLTVPGGYIIGAVCMGARGRVDGAITDGKLGLRSGGSDYSSSGKTYNTGYEPRGRIDALDPNGSAAWSQSAVNALETYLEAV